jgi:hypothetical protein
MRVGDIAAGDADCKQGKQAEAPTFARINSSSWLAMAFCRTATMSYDFFQDGIDVRLT